MILRVNSFSIPQSIVIFNTKQIQTIFTATFDKYRFLGIGSQSVYPFTKNMGAVHPVINSVVSSKSHYTGNPMFCPKCRAEYRDGFHTCSDCQIDLVETLPTLPEPEFVNFNEILATYNPADVVFLKSLLESEGIQYFFKGEHFMYMRPLADPVRLMVRQDQVDEALELVKDVKLSVTGISMGERSDDEE